MKSIIIPFCFSVCSLQISNTIKLQSSLDNIYLDFNKDIAGLVRVKQGLIQGFPSTSSNGYSFYSFRGIPYAKPPIGSLRFKPPEPINSWKGILQADEDPNMCPQYRSKDVLSGVPQLLGDEDCLYLNVFTSKPGHPQARLPVMVYIHGGTFISGSIIQHKPDILMDKPIVLILVQYRLGVLGFLSTEDETMPGNLGLRDQSLALKWIQENVVEFGGDPSSVTLFGQSAGAASIHFQMITPYSKGLFRRVILQSGASYCPWTKTTNAKEGAEIVASEVQCPINDSKKFLSCLQEKPLEKIAVTHLIITKLLSHPLILAPRVDEDFLPDEPEVLLKYTDLSHIDYMAGTVRDEGAIATLLLFSNDTFVQAVNANFSNTSPHLLYLQNEDTGSESSKRAFQFYTNELTANIDNEEQITKMVTDGLFKFCHDLAALQHLRHNSRGNTFLYQLNHNGKVTMEKSIRPNRPSKYITHSDDIVYLFSGDSWYNKDLEDDEDLRVRKIFVDTWTNFAATGNPTPRFISEYNWLPAYSPNMRYFSIKPTPFMKPDTDHQIRKFWLSLPTEQNKLISSLYNSTYYSAKSASYPLIFLPGIIFYRPPLVSFYY